MHVPEGRRHYRWAAPPAKTAIGWHGGDVSVDGQLCLELNRAVRSSALLREGCRLLTRGASPALGGVLAILALTSRRRTGAASAVPLAAGLLAGALASGLAALLSLPAPGSGLHGLVVLAPSSALFGLPDASVAGIAAVVTVLFLRRARLLAPTGALLLVLAALADAASGTLYPSAVLTGLGLGVAVGLAAGALLTAPLARALGRLTPVRVVPLPIARLAAPPAGPAAHRDAVAGGGAVRLLSASELRPSPAPATAPAERANGAEAHPTMRPRPTASAAG